MHRLSTANTAAAAAPVALIVVAPNAAVATATAPEAASVTVAPNAAVKYLTVPLVDLITINDFSKFGLHHFLQRKCQLRNIEISACRWLN